MEIGQGTREPDAWVDAPEAAIEAQAAIRNHNNEQTGQMRDSVLFVFG